jgi:hypothetical protein
MFKRCELGWAFIFAAFAAVCLAGADSKEPWTKTEIITPAELTRELSAAPAGKIILIHVGFRTLYNQGRIPGSQYAGPGSKAEGLAALRKLVEKNPRNQMIVIYCGCCPWQECPNIRPAFQELKQMGFTNLKVLELPDSLVTDWVGKGYPISRGN